MNEKKVLATINGKDITQQDVYAFLNQLPPQTAAQFNSSEGMKRLTNELVNQELLYLDAIENGLDKEEEFKEQLEKVRGNVLKQYAINKLMSGTTTSEEEMEEFYNTQQENFKVPEKVRASHILIDDEEKANSILSEINDGLSFGEAAKKYSTCPSKENGGDLGEFSRGKMVPEFENAAFDMKEGEISEPVKSQFGYHIIKVTGKKEPSISSFEEVKDQIEKHLVGLKQQEKYLNKTNELKDKYEVKTYL
ncbi:peptidylprolyl isomerase [Schnuerera sp. xch1]|uniref:peptidylprolyl isomerase n=1 Tax=Schnuerera sp. xch1 TaxID=2874283 RepID=UPI001CBB6E05|nr:peptidylprolyl isomerase [Schnuerera sp. xch1]MBZ2174417.1 peptidylprolyl isomerase [Schnuerera sp. xch1]